MAQRDNSILKWNYGTISRIILQIILIIAASAGSVFAIIKAQGIYLIITIPIIIAETYRIIKAYNYSLKKVAFMFNAIDCNDYNFSFVHNTKNFSQNILNEALNRIKEIMTNTKIRAIEREKYYELIMNSVKTGIITINKNGNIFQINNEAYKILNINILTHIKQLGTLYPSLPSLLNSIKADETKKVTLRNEFGEIQLSISASKMYYDNKELKILSIDDINKALNEKEAEAWIKLTRVLTHEIMNSLSPITSISETMIRIVFEYKGISKRDDIQNDFAKNVRNMQNIQEGLVTINSTCKSLIEFVDSYRKFTRLQTPAKTLFELKPLIEHSVNIIKESFTCKTDHCNLYDSLFEIKIEPSDTLIYADRNMIYQVIVNLLKNAYQAIKQKEIESSALKIAFTGKISISTRIKVNEDIEINISNNGGAIPDEISDSIFTPFFTTKEQGSGVGLSVCRQIIHLHNGTLQLTSNTSDNVCFTICI